MLLLHASAMEAGTLRDANEDLQAIALARVEVIRDAAREHEQTAERLASSGALQDLLASPEDPSKATAATGALAMVVSSTPEQEALPQSPSVTVIDASGAKILAVGSVLLADQEIEEVLHQVSDEQDAYLGILEAEDSASSQLVVLKRIPMNSDGLGGGFVVVSSHPRAWTTPSADRVLLGVSGRWTVVDLASKKAFVRSSGGYEAGTEFPTDYPALTSEAADDAVYDGLNGVGVLGHAEMIPEYGWAVLAEATYSTVVAGADVRLGWSLSILIGVLGVAVFLGWRISSGIYSWANDLNAAMVRFREGDLSSRADVECDSHFGEAARNFNELADAMESSNQSLNAAREDAERQSCAKSDFLANMSHEIRTPLTALLGFTQVLHSAADLTTTQRGQVDSILRAGRHLADLVTDVLEMSRIEAGRTSVTIRPVSMTAMLEELHGLFELSASNSGLRFELICKEGLPESIHTDRRKLRQILINLIGNAIRLTDDGSVLVVASPSESSGGVSVEVIDTGRGIAAADQERIFLAFDQGGELPAVSGGTGLGLSISRTYAEILGGTLKVASALGEGATFTIAIPDLRETDSECEVEDLPSEEIDASEIGELLVLLADDDSGIASALSQGIAIGGGRVVSAVSGESAVEAFSPAIDLIIMDLRMPGIGGLEAIRQIRSHAGGEAVAIVALSGAASPADVEQAIQAGADDFLAKPVDFDELWKRIRGAIGIRKKSLSSTKVIGHVDEQAVLSALDEVPREVLITVAGYATEGDICGLREALDNMSKEYVGAADIIGPLIKSFRYERIIELCDPSTK